MHAYWPTKYCTYIRTKYSTVSATNTTTISAAEWPTHHPTIFFSIQSTFTTANFNSITTAIQYSNFDAYSVANTTTNVYSVWTTVWMPNHVTIDATNQFT
jgi:hypothetical protein